MAPGSHGMMILIDTIVWIDFFNASSLHHVEMLENLISNKEDICICGIILSEVLQGIRKDSEYKKTRELFKELIILPMNNSTFFRSAEIYRTLRRKGITIRKPLDCMIASVAIENEILLLHNDRDFDPIEKYFGLKTLKQKQLR